MRSPRTQPQTNLLANPEFNPAALWNLALDVETISSHHSVLAPDSATRVLTAHGVGVAVSGTTRLNRYSLKCPDEAVTIGSDDFSALCLFTANTNAGYGIFGKWNIGSSPGTNEWLILPQNGFNSSPYGIGFSVEVGNTTYSTYATIPAYVAGHTYLAIGTRAGTTLSIYVYNLNTGLFYSNSTTNAGITTVNTVAGRVLRLGELNSNLYNINQTTYLAATFKYALSLPQVLNLVDNPYQLYKSRSLILPEQIGDATASGTIDSVDLSAPTGTASSSATASGSVDSVDLSAPAGTATAGSDATATGTIDNIDLTAPGGTAASSSIASGAIDGVDLAAPTGTASGSSHGSATGAIDNIDLSAPTGTASASTLTLTQDDLDAIAAAVWSHQSAANVITLLTETWGRLGLDINAPLITGTTEITFGAVVMAMTEATGSVTLARQ